MTGFDTRSLIIPPDEDEPVDEYRPVWRSIALETGILLGITGALFVLANILGISLPANLYPLITLALAVAPFALWLTFSWYAERAAPMPRQRLLAVAVISGLAANAVGTPLIEDFLQVDRWLPLSSAINRIIGYSFTVGIVQEALKYMVVRYTVWPGSFRVRLDGVAYGAASAIGYATVLNLQFVLSTTPPPDVAALRIFGTIVLHLVNSTIIGYGLAEVRFSNPAPFLMPAALALAAFITGVTIPIRAGLVNATLELAVSTPRPLFGFGFSIALLIVPMLMLAFLFDNAERQAREAARDEDQISR